jgi:small-conductance mechanosensitive channel
VETIKEILVSIKDFLDIPLFKLGETHVTLWAILYLLILLVLLFYLTAKLKYFIVARLLAKSSIEIGVRQAVGSIIRYGVVAVGFVIIFETVGIDLSALTILAGALGIGVGFGLQNITNIPVGVSYSSDPEAVKRILLEVADEHSGVLKAPEPDVIFEEFGESSLNFLLRVWTREYTTRPYILRSELNFAIKKKFREHGIEIPFPQRDLHIRSGAVELKPST